MDHFVIVIKCVQRALNNDREVLRVEPVKKQVEVAVVNQATHYTSKNVQDLKDFGSRGSDRSHLRSIHLENLLNGRMQLVQILIKVPYVVLSQPQTRQDFEELTKLFVLAWVLKYSKLSYMSCRYLLYYRNLRKLSTSNRVKKILRENLKSKINNAQIIICYLVDRAH